MKLFEVTNKYCKESNWKTLALIKICVFSIGIIVGVLLPNTFRIVVLIIFGALFLISYVPLMIKFRKINVKKYNRKSIYDKKFSISKTNYNL